MRGSLTLGSLLALLIAVGTPSVFAQLVGTVEVDVTESNGIYTYDYTVSNGFLSSTSINGFLLTVARGDDVVLTDPDDFLGEFVGHGLDAPENWTGAYQPFLPQPPCEPERLGTLAADYQAAWVAGDGLEVDPAGTHDLFQGESLEFSITSRYAPATNEYLLVNITPGCADAEFLGLAEGSVLSPGIAPPTPALACDFDGDGDCDLVDIDSLAAAVGTDDATFDLNADGMIDIIDIEEFLAAEEVNTLNGDADFNGTVEFPDFLQVSTNFGQPAPWSGGNFDGVGTVDFPDFLILADNFGASAPIGDGMLAAVPEPTASLMATAFLFGLLPWRRSIK